MLADSSDGVGVLYALAEQAPDLNLKGAVVVMLGGGATALRGDWVPLGWQEIGSCAAAALGAAGGYVGFVAGLRMGELSFVATFRYSAIPLAMLIGLIVWGDVPGPRMLAGAALIVGSGFFILLHERRLTRKRRAVPG